MHHYEFVDRIFQRESGPYQPLSRFDRGRKEQFLAIRAQRLARNHLRTSSGDLSTAVILTTLSGTSYMPALVAACFASFLLTTRISLIRTQRSRTLPSASPPPPAPVIQKLATE